MTDRRFSISIHILTLLYQNEGEWLSSDYLAGSMNINPVLVRKELSNLRKNGFILSKEGKNGGCMLAKSANSIYISEIFEAISPKKILGTDFDKPNPLCPIGRQINEHLAALSLEVKQTITNSLKEETLADFSNRFK